MPSTAASRAGSSSASGEPGTPPRRILSRWPASSRQSASSSRASSSSRLAASLYLIPSDEYILLPDRARPLAPFVKVKGERSDQDGGGIYYVAVEVKKASLLEHLIPGIHEGSTLVPASLILGPKETEKQHQRREIQAMSLSQQVGAAVALKALGYSVKLQSPGMVIEAVDPQGPVRRQVARTGHRRQRGRPPHSFTLTELRQVVRGHKPGDQVAGDCPSRREASAGRRQDDPGSAGRRAGRSSASSRRCVSQTFTKVKLPVPVNIDLGQVGGPSAGLAFALDVVEELGRDIDQGYKVAASGEICADGTVVAVGGLKQKTIGARRAGIDVFLVPAGENTAEAAATRATCASSL